MRSNYIELSVIKIQKWFRHCLKGKKIRNDMKYKYKQLFKLKSFVIRCVLDSNTFIYCKSYKDYINHIYNSIEVWINLDEDDEENYSFSLNQKTVIENILKKSHVNFNDVKTSLKTLTIDQLQFI
jgi:hypothetical protein